MRRASLASRRVPVLAFFVSAAALASGGRTPISRPARRALDDAQVAPVATVASLDFEYTVVHVGSVVGVLYAVPLSSF
jgi:hypothetical protein